MPVLLRYLSLSLLLFLFACAAAPGDAGYFRCELALQHSHKLGGCAIGDLDPRYPGAEIATVSVSGEVFVLHWEQGRWHSQLVFRCPGEALQCVIGDALPEQEGQELLVVGMAKGREEEAGPGAAHLIRWDGQAWQGRKIHQEAALVHGGAIGEGSLLLVGFTKQAIVFSPEAGALRLRARVPLPGRGKTALWRGSEYVVACSDGSLVQIQGSGASWQARTLEKIEAGRARLACQGQAQLLVADDDGGLRLLTASGSKKVYSEGQKLRGAGFGPFVPEHPVKGPQLACAGYEGKIVVLLPGKGGEYRPLTLFQGRERFHHLAAGSLGRRPGRALVACGYGGRVLVLRWVH
ncbi:MAG: hypothetical protein CSA62_01315 [Planctomycetota bacterium]|nr:MAG: hypothetical protein CSA62_01315 [Planctomycetota bacterium]